MDERKPGFHQEPDGIEKVDNPDSGNENVVEGQTFIEKSMKNEETENDNFSRKMSRTTSVITMIITGFVGLVISSFIFYAFNPNIRYDKPVAIMGNVYDIDVYLYQVKSSKDNNKVIQNYAKCDYRYEYMDNGTTYKGRGTILNKINDAVAEESDCLSLGDKIEITYDKSNPRESMLKDNQDFLDPLLLILVSGFFFIVGIFSIFNKNIKFKRRYKLT